MVQDGRVKRCVLISLKAPKLQLAVEQSLTRGHWNSPKKDTPCPKQRRSHNEMVGGTSVQPLSHIQLFVTPWTAAHEASLSINNSRSLLKLMSIEVVMPFNHLILYCPLLLPPSVFPSIRVFSNASGGT